MKKEEAERVLRERPLKLDYINGVYTLSDGSDCLALNIEVVTPWQYESKLVAQAIECISQSNACHEECMSCPGSAGCTWGIHAEQCPNHPNNAEASHE